MLQYDPAAFHEIFAALTNLPIVGGQAVNLWAEIYGAHERQLDEHRPFLSKDADLFGERPAIEAQVVPKGWTVLYYGVPRQMAVALLTKDLPGSEQMRVEVLRSVYGLQTRDIADTTLVEVSPGRTYRLPSPIVLLKAKIANTHDLVKKERPQDLKHVRMLVIICAHYLRDLHARAHADQHASRSPRRNIDQASAGRRPQTPRGLLRRKAGVQSRSEISQAASNAASHSVIVAAPK